MRRAGPKSSGYGLMPLEQRMERPAGSQGKQAKKLPMRLVYIVLAAGDAKRMGRDKAIEPLAGRSPLARLARTLGDREAIVVTSGRLAEACAAAAPNATIAVNADPSRGMTSSLAAAGEFIDPGAAIGVLLADKPLLDEATLIACERAFATSNADVLYPVDANGNGGHPVYFAARARGFIATLPGGDTLRQLRDHPHLASTTLRIDDPGAYLDLDTPEHWQQAETMLLHEP
jgi:CTP:molybdopterin cytidylyltransferase MocA